MAESVPVSSTASPTRTTPGSNTATTVWTPVYRTVRDLRAEIETLRGELADRDRLRTSAHRVVQLAAYGSNILAVGNAIHDLRQALEDTDG